MVRSRHLRQLAHTSQGFNPAYKFDTIGGTFALWDSGDTGFNAANPYRNSLANYFLPNIDEWYKAAYYDPVAGDYNLYPTGSDSAPDGIDTAGDTSFDAVFRDPFDLGAPKEITNTGTLSPYGTMGQGGNVWEWGESALDGTNNDPNEIRGRRGGSWGNNGSNNLQATTFNGSAPDTENFGFGFRVAALSPVPEPYRAFLVLLGTAAAALTRRRRIIRVHREDVACRS